MTSWRAMELVAYLHAHEGAKQYAQIAALEAARDPTKFDPMVRDLSLYILREIGGSPADDLYAIYPAAYVVVDELARKFRNSR